jgi:glycosyltransferase involved in cell wall biosynthesis
MQLKESCSNGTFPNAPFGKYGWPWTSGKMPKRSVEINDLPKVSIVTPSFNQGRFIEETIRSVLLQGYPNLEYIIIDGGSSDNSTKIIEKYGPWLSYWVSEPDRNQSNAINKGFERASGDIFGWLNSDDTFMPKAIANLVELRKEYPDAVAWTGSAEKVNLKGKSLGIHKARLGSTKDFGNFGHGACVYQPSTFIDSKIFNRIGGINEDLEIGLDVELWMRIAQNGHFASTEEVISVIKMYPEAKHLENPLATYVELITINQSYGFRDNAQKWLLFFAEKYKEGAIDLNNRKKRELQLK